jgi:hypothetical protein
MQPTPLKIPEQMRDAADRSVDQAKKTFQQFLDAARKAAAAAEGSAKSLGEKTTDINRRALAFVEEQIAASFDLAQRLVQARTIEEMAALQQKFLKRQMEGVASKTRTADLAEAQLVAARTQAMPPEPDTHSKVGRKKSTQSHLSKARIQKRPVAKSATKKSKRGGRK